MKEKWRIDGGLVSLTDLLCLRFQTYINGLSIKDSQFFWCDCSYRIFQKTLSNKRFFGIENIQNQSTSVPDASQIQGTLPRANKVSTGHFVTLPSARSPFRVPSRALKNPNAHKGTRIFWCERWDSNPHGIHHMHLKRDCLPFQHSRKH